MSESKTDSNNKKKKKKGEGDQCDCLNYNSFPHRRKTCMFRKAGLQRGTSTSSPTPTPEPPAPSTPIDDKDVVEKIQSDANVTSPKAMDDQAKNSANSVITASAEALTLFPDSSNDVAFSSASVDREDSINILQLEKSISDHQEQTTPVSPETQNTSSMRLQKLRQRKEEDKQIQIAITERINLSPSGRDIPHPSTTEQSTVSSTESITEEVIVQSPPNILQPPPVPTPAPSNDDETPPTSTDTESRINQPDNEMTESQDQEKESAFLEPTEIVQPPEEITPADTEPMNPQDKKIESQDKGQKKGYFTTYWKKLY